MEPRMRPAGWEARLNDVLKRATVKEFDARAWNCARFAHACAEAVSGRSLSFSWKGSLEASADAVLGRISPRQAMRGDIVLANVPEPTLGVCCGAVAVFVGPSGLHREPMRRVAATWSV